MIVAKTKWAEFSTNRVDFVASETEDGIVYQSNLVSSLLNGAFYNGFKWMDDIQRLHSCWSKQVTYDLNAMVYVIWDSTGAGNNVVPFISKKEKNYGNYPIIDGTIISDGEIPIFRGGKVNVDFWETPMLRDGDLYWSENNIYMKNDVVRIYYNLVDGNVYSKKPTADFVASIKIMSMIDNNTIRPNKYTLFNEWCVAGRPFGSEYTQGLIAPDTYVKPAQRKIKSWARFKYAKEIVLKQDPNSKGIYALVLAASNMKQAMEALTMLSSKFAEWEKDMQKQVPNNLDGYANDEQFSADLLRNIATQYIFYCNTMKVCKDNRWTQDRIKAEILPEWDTLAFDDFNEI